MIWHIDVYHIFFMISIGAFWGHRVTLSVAHSDLNLLLSTPWQLSPAGGSTGMGGIFTAFSFLKYKATQRGMAELMIKQAQIKAMISVIPASAPNSDKNTISHRHVIISGLIILQGSVCFYVQGSLVSRFDGISVGLRSGVGVVGFTSAQTMSLTFVPAVTICWSGDGHLRKKSQDDGSHKWQTGDRHGETCVSARLTCCSIWCSYGGPGCWMFLQGKAGNLLSFKKCR